MKRQTDTSQETTSLVTSAAKKVTKMSHGLFLLTANAVWYKVELYPIAVVAQSV
jgi:hypothetical protein